MPLWESGHVIQILHPASERVRTSWKVFWYALPQSYRRSISLELPFQHLTRVTCCCRVPSLDFLLGSQFSFLLMLARVLCLCLGPTRALLRPPERAPRRALRLCGPFNKRCRFIRCSLVEVSLPFRYCFYLVWGDRRWCFGGRSGAVCALDEAALACAPRHRIDLLRR